MAIDDTLNVCNYTLNICDEKGVYEESTRVDDSVLPRIGDTYDLKRTDSDGAHYKVTDVTYSAITDPRDYQRTKKIKIQEVNKTVTIQRIPVHNSND